MEGSAVKADRVMADLRSSSVQGLAAGRQKHKVIGALNEVRIGITLRLSRITAPFQASGAWLSFSTRHN
jgi:hypothetical protein